MSTQASRGPLSSNVRPSAGADGDVFQDGEKLLKSDPVAAFRAFRDEWLKAAYSLERVETLEKPWKDFWRAALEWSHGKEAAALGLLNKASRAGKRYLWMRYYIAELLLRRLDLFGPAREEIERVIRDCPWLWEARCLRAELLVAFDVKDPLKEVRAAKVPETSHSPFLAWRGALGLWSGDYKRALADLNAAADVQNHDAFCWRGGTLASLKRYEEARADLERLLAADPHDPEALTWCGEVNRRLGRIPQSLAALDAVISQNGEWPWARANRALIRLSENNVDAARQDFARLFPNGTDQKPVVLEACRSLDAKRLKTLLEKLFKSARGCRRSDPHLNAGWMRAAGVPVPDLPPRGAGFVYWLRHMKVPTPQDHAWAPPPGADRAALEASR